MSFEADFTFGQFGQLECVAASLQKLQEIATGPSGPETLRLVLMSQVLGIAGAMDGKLFLSLWTGFHRNMKILERLGDGATAKEVYYDAIKDTAKTILDSRNSEDSYSASTAADLSAGSADEAADPIRELRKIVASKFNPILLRAVTIESVTDALLRLAAMLRWKSFTEFGLLLDALNDHDLSSGTLGYLVKELNLSGLDDRWAILLMHSPSILQTVTRHGKTKKNLQIGLRCLARLYEVGRGKIEGLLKEEKERFEDQWGSFVEGSGGGSGGGDGVAGEGLERLSAAGVYEVNCFQVAVWAEQPSKLATITERFKDCLVFNPIYLSRGLGEAELRVEMSELI